MGRKAVAGSDTDKYISTLVGEATLAPVGGERLDEPDKKQTVIFFNSLDTGFFTYIQGSPYRQQLATYLYTLLTQSLVTLNKPHRLVIPLSMSLCKEAGTSIIR